MLGTHFRADGFNNLYFAIVTTMPSEARQMAKIQEERGMGSDPRAVTAMATARQAPTEGAPNSHDLASRSMIHG